MPRPISGGSITNGGVVVVGATATPGTVLHIATSLTNIWDEVYLYAYSTAGSAATVVGTDLTIEWGGVDASNQMVINVEPSCGPVLITPGLLVNNGNKIAAYAETANVINVYGMVYQNGE